MTLSEEEDRTEIQRLTMMAMVKAEHRRMAVSRDPHVREFAPRAGLLDRRCLRPLVQLELAFFEERERIEESTDHSQRRSTSRRPRWWTDLARGSLAGRSKIGARPPATFRINPGVVTAREGIAV